MLVTTYKTMQHHNQEHHNWHIISQSAQLTHVKFKTCVSGSFLSFCTPNSATKLPKAVYLWDKYDHSRNSSKVGKRASSREISFIHLTCKMSNNVMLYLREQEPVRLFLNIFTHIIQIYLKGKKNPDTVNILHGSAHICVCAHAFPHKIQD
jgi:hypothetical protein